jgi:hypothetical protein
MIIELNDGDLINKQEKIILSFVCKAAGSSVPTHLDDVEGKLEAIPG